ncbi:ATP-dependent protease ATPase subunit HslU [Clostridia bacterium OttesenSCG-928-F22]|nr:ATP-dependent protease ATPase subunit HslU [Clostridia bacterium OttesenSCG-928-F22]
MQLTPREIVDQLGKYIVGQDKAKRAVAVALRNRYRRARLDENMRDEITPKNIIMMGPTGVGKTEIARRIAKLVDAPFIKVEATKFTEVGYVGRDVDSMVRDLIETAVRMVKNNKLKEVQITAQVLAENRIADILSEMDLPKQEKPAANPFQMLMGNVPEQTQRTPEEEQQAKTKREQALNDLRAGRVENTVIEIEVEETGGGNDMLASMGIEINIQEMLGPMVPKRTKQRRVPVSEARKILEQEEANKLIDMDEVIQLAVIKAEQEGIIFIDEIDKIAGKNMSSGPDVSREGVQRDILPIIEGSTVSTKYGPVKTDYMLFIAAGAFHVAKVSDLIPELQGRFPIRVELTNLSKEDLRNILIQPQNAITKQYELLLATDNVNITFGEDALDLIAEYAFEANETSENIGARRLHTIIENLLEDISFNAGGNHPVIELNIDAAYVREHLGENESRDLHKYIL